MHFVVRLIKGIVLSVELTRFALLIEKLHKRSETDFCISVGIEIVELIEISIVI
ncbi:hypothetical protein GCM10028825_25930 [Spirosoma agri]